MSPDTDVNSDARVVVLMVNQLEVSSDNIVGIVSKETGAASVGN